MKRDEETRNTAMQVSSVLSLIVEFVIVSLARAYLLPSRANLTIGIFFNMNNKADGQMIKM